MSRRGDPRLPTADQIERHGLKDWAHRLVLRLYDRFREIDNDLFDEKAPAGTSGTWTPVLTFATPGNLSITYSTQTGTYVTVGDVVHLNFSIVCSSFTHSTASGACSITGLPFASDGAVNYQGSLLWEGITKASYTTAFLDTGASSSSTLRVLMGGSGLTATLVAASDMPSGGTPALVGQITYVR